MPVQISEMALGTACRQTPGAAAVGVMSHPSPRSAILEIQQYVQGEDRGHAPLCGAAPFGPPPHCWKSKNAKIMKLGGSTLSRMQQNSKASARDPGEGPAAAARTGTGRCPAGTPGEGPAGAAADADPGPLTEAPARGRAPPGKVPRFPVPLQLLTALAGRPARRGAAGGTGKAPTCGCTFACLPAAPLGAPALAKAVKSGSGAST